MARLAVSLAGAAVGGFLGGPTGAQWGFLAGSMVGGALFPEKLPTVEGPRLNEKQVTSSAYGAPIAIPYGTVRTSGNVIWSGGIVETRHSENVGGGKGGMGGGSQKAVTYTYSCSFALALGEGVAEDVLRIWADSKLIFDKTGTGQLSKGEVSFRFYPGDESQLPDSIIEAKEGVGNVPAFRGICYLVFDSLQLADYGNRIPNITAEVTYRKQAALPYVLDTRINSPVTTWQGDQMTVDPVREYFYLVSSTATPGVRKFDARTMREVRSILWADLSSMPAESFPRILGIDSDGNVHMSTGSQNGRPIIRVDPVSMKERNRFGTERSSSVMSPTGFGAIECMTDIAMIGPNGPRGFYVYASIFGNIGVLDDMFGFIAGDPMALPTRPRGACSGGGFVYLLSMAAGGAEYIYLHRLKIDPGAKPTIAPSGAWTQNGVELDQVMRLRYSDVGGTTPFTFCGQPMYDELDGGIVFAVGGGTDMKTNLVKVKGGDLAWASDVPARVTYHSTPCAPKLRYGRYAFMLGKVTYTVDLRNGSWKSQDWSATLPVQQTMVQYYNDVESSIIAVDNSLPRWFKVFLDRGDGLGSSLAVVVTDLCRRAGLTLAEIDVSELTETVRGYIVTRQMPARGALTPLLEAFSFDGVESDYVLKFRKRGRAVSRTITADELAYVKAEELMTESRTQEVELPEQLSVVYMSKEQDHQNDTQSAKRVVQPKPAMYSHNRVSRDIPIVFTASEAAALADVLLYRSWTERSAYTNRVPWKFLALDPSDVVQIDVDGVVRKCRIASASFGADFTIELESVAEESTVYTSPALGGAASGFPPQYIMGAIPSSLWTLDVPLLRDQDDTGGAYSVQYLAISAARVTGWAGAFVYRSTDATVWEDRATSLAPAQYGTAINALAAPRSAWELDEVSSLRVFMEHGTLESCTYLDVLNGKNACVINGEVCAFMSAVLGADGYYTLTGWLRGLRGTDYACDGHVAGERITMLSTATVVKDTVSIDLLNSSVLYKGVTFATLLEDATVVGTTPKARDLMPWSPVHVVASTDGSGNVTLSWIRRTRTAGGLQDGTDYVPLQETFEKYEVDVMNGSAVVRTLRVENATSVVYSSADRTADGLGSASELTVTVYQMSASVGRGFGRTSTVGV